MGNPNSPSRRRNNKGRGGRHSPRRDKSGAKRDQASAPTEMESMSNESDEKRLREGITDHDDDVSMTGKEVNHNESARKDLLQSFNVQGTETDSAKGNVGVGMDEEETKEEKGAETMDIDNDDNEGMPEADTWKEPVQQQPEALGRATRICVDLQEKDEFTMSDHKRIKKMIADFCTTIGWTDDDSMPMDMILDSFDVAMEYGNLPTFRLKTYDWANPCFYQVYCLSSECFYLKCFFRCYHLFSVCVYSSCFRLSFSG